MSTDPRTSPRSVLIVGSGCFGLSTALALSTRPSFAHSTITLLDTSDVPNKDGSSCDLNRIVRSDYSNPLYAKLATEALHLWQRGEWGLEDRYVESGLLMLADSKTEYLTTALELARASGRKNDVCELVSEPQIKDACKTGGSSGNWGYLSRGAGWVDAERSISYAYEQVKKTGRVTFLKRKVSSLLMSSSKSQAQKKEVTGVLLDNGEKIFADLTIVAAGSYSPTLLDMRGIVAASAEVFAYINLTEEEALRLKDMPAIINLSKGWFIMPPNRNTLKIARHGLGFPNPTKYTHPEIGEDITLSTPHLSTEKQQEFIEKGLAWCTQALQELIPSLAGRAFDRTRLCWYTDTPNADFILDYHPKFEGLFVATGGSGHGFKFLPVLGQRVVDRLEGTLASEYRELWAWPASPIQEVSATKKGIHDGAFVARGGVIST
jgi:sarcosine oxidase/L-pipecolate oxidase